MITFLENKIVIYSRFNDIQSHLKVLCNELKNPVPAIALGIKPNNAKNIRNGTKNHKYRKYELPAKQVWLYKTELVNAITTVVELGPEKKPGEVQDPSGLGNDDFDDGRKEAKHGYLIDKVYVLPDPIPSEELEKKYDLPNPRHPAFAPLPPEVIKEHPRNTWKEIPHPKNSFSSEFNAYETIVAIAQSTMYGALNLLQDYDVHGQWGFMISPKTVVQLRKMSLDDAAKWLETNMLQTMAYVRSQVQEPNFMDEVLRLSLLVHGLAVTLDNK
jgi:hypothetical protein